jgi:hypothetical protein
VNEFEYALPRARWALDAGLVSPLLHPEPSVLVPASSQAPLHGLTNENAERDLDQKPHDDCCSHADVLPVRAVAVLLMRNVTKICLQVGKTRALIDSLTRVIRVE